MTPVTCGVCNRPVHRSRERSAGGRRPGRRGVGVMSSGGGASALEGEGRSGAGQGRCLHGDVTAPAATEPRTRK